MSNTCQFCNNSFNSKTSLYSHQRRTKYCLEKQGVHPEKFTCTICNKIFYQKRYLLSHTEKCNSEIAIENYKKIIGEQKEAISNTLEREKLLKQQVEKYESIIQDLTNKLENVAIKGATKATNTNIIKLECLTQSHLQDCARLITDNDILNYDNLAKFAVENSFKNRVVTTDLSRKTLSYKNEDGKIKKDPKGKKLAVMFFSSIKDCDTMIDRVKNIILSELTDKTSDTEREYIFNRMNEIIKVYKGVKKISEGQENELKEEFIDKLCKFLPSE